MELSKISDEELEGTNIFKIKKSDLLIDKAEYEKLLVEINEKLALFK